MGIKPNEAKLLGIPWNKEEETLAVSRNHKERRVERLASVFDLACIAGVPVLFRILVVCKLEREKKIVKAGGVGASEENLALKPLDFEKPVHSRTGHLIGVVWSS